MKRHTDIPGWWLLLSGFSGGLAAIFLQINCLAMGILLILCWTVSMIIGILKVKVFYR